MAEKIHIIIQNKDRQKLRAMAFKYNVSCSAVADVIGYCYSPFGQKYNINRDVLEDPKETVLKIKTEHLWFEVNKTKMEYYSTVLYYYFNQNKLPNEERKIAKEFNKRIAHKLNELVDPNALYNQVIRMNYRAKKEFKKCKK